MTLTATSATPVTWTIDSGSLPGGLLLSSGGSISGTPTVNGTFSFTVKATNSGGVDTKALSIVISASSGGGSPGGGGTPPAPTYTADIEGTDTSGNAILNTSLPVTVDTDTGSATVNIGSQQSSLITGGGTAVITVPSIPNVDTYTLGIPVAYLSAPDGKGTLTYKSGNGAGTVQSPVEVDKLSQS